MERRHPSVENVLDASAILFFGHGCYTGNQWRFVEYWLKDSVLGGDFFGWVEAITSSLKESIRQFYQTYSLANRNKYYTTLRIFHSLATINIRFPL
ncbi:MAG: hypothetical protein L7F78_17350, partial [Syntrophales bacterium LBB04]|nr:hypothetical protein [Syntrophales bacterium LBB04]